MAAKGIHEKIAQANQKVVDIFVNGQPVWIDVQPAGSVVPDMPDNMILYAGPVIDKEDIVLPVRNAICGAAVHEGLAPDLEAAWAMVMRGEILLDAAQNHNCANGAAMATSASMPVCVVRDAVNGTCGFCVPHPGNKREVLRWGFYNESIERDMVWFRDVFGPGISAALRHMGGMNLKELLAKTAGMGDENHVRQPASSMAMDLMLISALTEVDVAGRDEIIRFLAGNDRFSLHVMMAASQCAMAAAKKVPYSSVMVGFGGNGVELGIQMAGTGNTWYTVPAPKILGMFLNPTYTEEDILGFLGDSCVTEVYGFGGFSAIAGPAFVIMTGDTFEEARRRTERARSLSLGEHKLPVPWDGNRGLPCAIDVRRVVAQNQAPISHGGSTLKNGGQGGAGSAELPMEMFRQALMALSRAVSEEEK